MSVAATDSAALRFLVFGRPQGKGSKRMLPIKRKVGPSVVLVDSNRNAAPWASQVSDKALLAMANHPVWGYRGSQLMRGPVAVEMDFYFSRPRSHYGTGRNAGALKASAPREMATMPDLDKLARCSLDALTGVVFHDDGQVAELALHKRYGEPERLEAVVREL